MVHRPGRRGCACAVYVRDAAGARPTTGGADARRGGRPNSDRRVHGAVLIERDHNGRLRLGGIAADELARVYDTPLLAIDLDVIDATIAQLLRSAPASELEISYAAKAFATIEFIRHLARHPIGFDVCSLGELATAERAGVAAQRITLHGAGKTDEELRAACAGRVAFIAVDGLAELEKLAAISREGCRAAVILRLNVGIDARTHAYVRTGGDDTKFGIHTRDEAAAIALIRANPQLSFAGLHAHIGSQIFDASAYAAICAALLDAAARFARGGVTTPRIVIGGGFGVATHPADGPSLEVESIVAQVRASLAKQARERGIAAPTLGIEPGRAIVATAGTTLYRVLATKRQSQRTFVIVDGGIAENPRPALYGARHYVVTATPIEGREVEMTLCGRSCENDELGIASLPECIRSGDLLAMCVTGAYTYSMAGNYNRLPRPAVAGIAGGSHRLLARRESLDDVLRRDVDLEPAQFESEPRSAAL